MATYKQSDRWLTVTTPLGPDDLLLVGFTAHEAISQLFAFQLDLIAENATDVPFDRLLGRKMTVNVTLPDAPRKRYFSGICSRISQAARDNTFTSYRAEVVPELWLLSKKAQSRIFQQVAVPDILKQVLAGLDVAFELRGTYKARDYCVQYRETDFNFASRLMEEEGIYYYFRHTATGHTLVVADTPQGQPDLPPPSQIIYEGAFGGVRDEDRVHDWEKTQELRSGQYTLWDHHFELPHKHLEAQQNIQASVTVGQVTHQLNVGNNGKLEVYDYPGEYAQRYDGIDPGGGERPADLQNIFTDNQRTAVLRMQEEALPGLVIRGTGNCRHFTSGYAFTLTRHFNADGKYLLTGVQHAARMPDNYRAGNSEVDSYYENKFTCTPFDLPFRPRRVTPKPFVQGTQTAVVVGPPGEEIFTDKYGRVKVQFHWDRQGKLDSNSSCWIRVGALWAGTQWGTIHIPRVGQEVIVDFEEGDPDRPIITGSVYNAKMMPPYKLPDSKTKSVIKSNSTLGGAPDEANELTFEDRKGSEDIYFYAQKDSHRVVKNDDDLQVGNAQTISVEKSIKMVAGTSDTTRQPNGYGGGAALAPAGDQTGGIGGGSKGTIDIEAGDKITLKAGDSSQGGSSGSNNNKDQIKQLLKMQKMLTQMANPISQIADSILGNVGGQIEDLIGGGGSSSGTIDIEADGTITVKSQAKIVLQVGDSKITIDDTGVSMTGMTITIGSGTSTMIVIINGDEVNMSKNVTIEGGFEILGGGVIDGVPIT
jgi:type VI secretion system secreted protein VgrG